MITKYKIDKDNLILDIKFLYDVGFKEDRKSDIYKYVNQILTKNKIKFQGKRILVFINGILIGRIYLTNYYLPKRYRLNHICQVTNFNSYFERYKVLTINVQN